MTLAVQVESAINDAKKLRDGKSDKDESRIQKVSQRMPSRKATQACGTAEIRRQRHGAATAGGSGHAARALEYPAKDKTCLHCHTRSDTSKLAADSDARVRAPYNEDDEPFVVSAVEYEASLLNFATCSIATSTSGSYWTRAQESTSSTRKTVKRLPKQPVITPTPKQLFSYTGSAIDVLGTTELCVVHRGKSAICRFFIARRGANILVWTAWTSWDFSIPWSTQSTTSMISLESSRESSTASVWPRSFAIDHSCARHAHTDQFSRTVQAAAPVPLALQDATTSASSISLERTTLCQTFPVPFRATTRSTDSGDDDDEIADIHQVLELTDSIGRAAGQALAGRSAHSQCLRQSFQANWKEPPTDEEKIILQAPRRHVQRTELAIPSGGAGIDAQLEDLAKSCVSCCLAEKWKRPAAPSQTTEFPKRAVAPRFSLTSSARSTKRLASSRFAIVAIDLHSKWPEIRTTASWSRGHPPPESNGAIGDRASSPGQQGEGPGWPPTGAESPNPRDCRLATPCASAGHRRPTSWRQGSARLEGSPGTAWPGVLAALDDGTRWHSDNLVRVSSTPSADSDTTDAGLGALMAPTPAPALAPPARRADQRDAARLRRDEAPEPEELRSLQKTLNLILPPRPSSQSAIYGRSPEEQAGLTEQASRSRIAGYKNAGLSSEGCAGERRRASATTNKFQAAQPPAASAGWRGCRSHCRRRFLTPLLRPWKNAWCQRRRCCQGGARPGRPLPSADGLGLAGLAAWPIAQLREARLDGNAAAAAPAVSRSKATRHRRAAAGGALPSADRRPVRSPDTPPLPVESAWASTNVGLRQSRPLAGRCLRRLAPWPPCGAAATAGAPAARSSPKQAAGPSPKPIFFFRWHLCQPPEDAPCLRSRAPSSRWPGRSTRPAADGLVRGMPAWAPQLAALQPCLPLLARLAFYSEPDILSDVCWALAYAVIDTGVCRRLVALIQHPQQLVARPALASLLLNCQLLPALSSLLSGTVRTGPARRLLEGVKRGGGQPQPESRRCWTAAWLARCWRRSATPSSAPRKEAAWFVANAASGGSPEQELPGELRLALQPLCEPAELAGRSHLWRALTALEAVLRLERDHWPRPQLGRTLTHRPTIEHWNEERGMLTSSRLQLDALAVARAHLGGDGSGGLCGSGGPSSFQGAALPVAAGFHSSWA
uniref:RICTOR_V domain-containing protein n=1 Tax=Macrostomum lignano TaxID=282301 RepID=A0A1I8FEA2_9PLAT